jgi:hypothetical protein
MIAIKTYVILTVALLILLTLGLTVNKDKNMSTYTINGRTISASGSSVVVSGNKVYIDGNLVTEDADTKLIIEGNVGEIKSCDRSIEIRGDVGGCVNARGSVTCGNVQGNVAAGGSVSCDNVGKNVDASGSVSCGKVSGSVDAGGSINGI